VTIFLPTTYKNTGEMPIMSWVILILLIDVAHVYSTLFRTYWNKKNLARHKTLYLAIPILCYVISVLLYTLNDMLFWRILAYLAVFHFIRQQYGIMRLYTRNEPQGTFRSWLDNMIIYAATLWPIIYWHCTPGRNFNWFVKGDFLITDAATIKHISAYFYLLIMMSYVINEGVCFLRFRTINIPKNMVIAGTILTWYFGIVYFNGDLTFTLLNVVSHGIPYMALIWAFERMKAGKDKNKTAAKSIVAQLLFFLTSIIVFAYLEEGMWDGLVWQEHPDIFGAFTILPIVTNKEILAFVIPLLSLPQTTHYVLDGFIWRKQQ